MKNIAGILSLTFLITACGGRHAEIDTGTQVLNDSGLVNKVVGIGRIEPESGIIQLSSPVNGIVSTILKNENDSVDVGTPILELDHRLEDAKLAKLETEIKTQIDQVKVDEASLGEFEAKYNNAILEVQRLKKLLSEGAETQQAVDNANTDLLSYKANLAKLNAAVLVSKSKLAQAGAALQVAKIERDQKIIRSPVKGKLLEIGTLPGSSVDTRQSFVQIGPVGRTIAVCEIDEMYADRVAVGQDSWIRNVGSRDTLSTGIVFSALSFLQKKSLFTDESGEKEDRRVRTIEILLDKQNGLLLNARVECVVNISGNDKR